MKTTLPRIASALCIPSLLALSVSACTSQGSQPTSPSAAAGSFSRSGVSASKPSETGCPAWGNPGGNPGVKFVGLKSPEEAVALSVAQITDAWYAEMGLVKQEFIAERLAAVIGLDKNGDGVLCLAMNWGQDLNPNSHWAEVFGDLLSPSATERWLFADNHAGNSTH